MKNSGLMDDDAISTPSIIEIPLKQLTVDVELGSSSYKADHSLLQTSSKPNCKENDVGGRRTPGGVSSDSSSPESDDSLLGGSRLMSEKSPSNTQNTAAAFTIQTLKSSPSLSARRLRKLSRDHVHRRHRFQKIDTASSPELDLTPDNILAATEVPDTCGRRHRSASVYHSNSSPVLTLDFPPNNIRGMLSSSSTLPSASVVNELSPRCQSRQQIPLTVANSTVGRMRTSDCRPNGNLIQHMAYFGEEHESDDDDDVDSEVDDAENVVCGEQAPTVLGDHSHLLKSQSNESHNLADSGASASNYCKKVLLPKANNISLARSLLSKTRSFQEGLCSDADSAQAEGMSEPFCLDSVTKEELLVLWKTSEIELNKRLEAALRDKSRLERKLALLQMQSPV